MMKLMIVLAAAIGYVALALAGHQPSMVAQPTATAAEESKVQPKQVTLAKDSQSDKYGEVAFNHETPSTKNYSPDGKSVIACTECHHTDQPASALKPPLKTSERNAVLTSALLATPDSA